MSESETLENKGKATTDKTTTDMTEETHNINDNVQADIPVEQKSSVLLTEGSFVADNEETVSQDINNLILNVNDNVNEDHVEQISQQTVGELKRTQDAAVIETLSDKLDNISIHEEEEDKEPAYMTPIPDPYARAIKYMENHNIMQIFQKLTAEIIYHRPDDPLTHMLGELQKMKKERESNPLPATLE